MTTNTQLIGRLLLANLFIASALYEATFGFNHFVGIIEEKGLPFPVILAIVALTVKLLGGFSVALDINAQLGALALIIFMLIVTPIYHNGFKDLKEMAPMLKNIAVIGGLMLLL